MTVPTRSAALLIIDMINTLDFDGGVQLLKQALPAAQRIARLKQRAVDAGTPVIYANDNYGQWRSDFRQVVDLCGQGHARGKDVVRMLAPGADDYFVLKPRHSAFHQTSLRLLLEDLGTRRLILTGVAADNCVLATATDAKVHGFELMAPADCVASETRERTRRALAQLSDTLEADTRTSSRITRVMLEEDLAPPHARRLRKSS